MSAIRASRIAPIVNGSGPEGPDPSGSGSPDELVAVDLDDAVERDRQLRERLALELPNTLAVEAERLADRLERLALAVEAETKLQDPPLALRQLRQHLANGLSLERLCGFLRRILSGRIAEEVAELSVVGRADRLVQRRRRLRDGECLGRVAKPEPRPLRKLLRRGEEPVPARPVHEERQRVGRAGQLGPDSLDRDRLLGLGLDDLDLAGLELGPDAGELVLIEVVLERKSFEVGRLDRPPLLGLGEKRLNWSFETGGV